MGLYSSKRWRVIFTRRAENDSCLSSPASITASISFGGGNYTPSHACRRRDGRLLGLPFAGGEFDAWLKEEAE
jgi:hypothetical protein